jgi:hypothetical protein
MGPARCRRAGRSLIVAVRFSLFLCHSNSVASEPEFLEVGLTPGVSDVESLVAAQRLHID